MPELTNVFCTYTGGNIYVITAQYGDVWIATDIEMVGTYDVPWEDIEEKYDCDYDSHEKKSAFPLPTWRVLLEAVRKSYESGVSTNMSLSEVDGQIRFCHPNLDIPIDAEDPARSVVPDDDRRDVICSIIEAFEDFLDEKGIVIPNDDKKQEPDSASNIYGTDYGILYDRIESILY